jgi:hypothetical protein
METLLILQPADGGKKWKNHSSHARGTLLQKAVNTTHGNASYPFSELAVVTLRLKTVIKICVRY